MKKINKKKLREIYKEFSGEIEKYLENELKLNYKPVEWIFLDENEFGEYLQGIILNDIPYWENGKEYWIYQKTKYTDIFYLISTGILEVIYNHGNKAIGLIRTDMPFSYQLYVLIHAYIHSVVFENHYITKYYQDVINYYVNIADKFSKEILEFEKQYGENYIVKLMDTLSLLATLSLDFVKDSNNKIIIDLEQTEFIINNYKIHGQNENKELKLPVENVEDILFFLYHLGLLPYYVKRLIQIMRIREIYKRSIYRIKYIHEGLCTFYENQIYNKLLPKFYEIIKKHDLIAEELIFTTIQNKHFSNYFSNIFEIKINENNDTYLALNFNNLIYNLFYILNDYYKFGYLFFDYNKYKLFKTINPFSITDEYLFILSNADIVNYLFNKHVANYIALKNYNQEVIKFYSCITDDDFKLLPENSAFYNFISDFIKQFYKQKLIKGYIPKEGYYQNKLIININIEKNNSLKLIDYKNNNFSDIFSICNNENYKINYDSSLELTLQNNIPKFATYVNNNIAKYFPIKEVVILSE